MGVQAWRLPDRPTLNLVFTKKVNRHARTIRCAHSTDTQPGFLIRAQDRLPNAADDRPPMTRNAMPQLDSFDPEVLDAARDVAARAGVPLETWIASVVPQGQPAPAGNRRHRRRHRAEQLAHTSGRPDTTNTPAEERRTAKAEPTEGYGDGIDALMDRLDGLNRVLDEERRSAQEAEARRLAEIEARIERAMKAAPVQEVTERLSDIERRMSQLGEQVAVTRQPGRRARPAAADLRNAIQDIRQRQRELSEEVVTAPAIEAASDGGVVASMRLDLARRLEARIEEVAAPSAALSELQDETARLREAINQLATSRDIGALEQAVVSLASGIERAQAGTDLTAIAAPIEQVRAQVERLAEEVAENVHSRVAEDVRRLAERLDTIAATGAADPEGPTLAGLFAELEEIRRLIATLAGPERIQSLANSLQAVSAQIAQLQRVGTGQDLRPLLEEIRSDVKIAAPAALTEQIQALAGKVDLLCARDDWSEHAVDGTAARSGEMASIHAMLRSLAEKVDQVGIRSEHEGLDALEKQVVSLAGRLDAPRVSDPALASLEHTMGELLRQVTALREDAPSEAAVERAARSAVAQTLKGSAIGVDSGEIGLLRASLADMQARQVTSDQRLGATLNGVQSALERLIDRLGPVDASGARAPSLDERLKSSTSPEAALAPLEARAAARQDGAETLRIADDLLEPGSGRPNRASRAGREAGARRSVTERAADPIRAGATEAAASETDIKTSFIAAARRAAQAAQAELAAEAPAERRGTRAQEMVLPAAGAEDGRFARLRAEIDRRRRPLLLGLAAIVLALGALQAITMRGAEEQRPAIASQAAPVREEPAKAAVPDAGRDDAKEAAKDSPAAKAPVSDPTTTQALPTPPSTEAHPPASKAAVPQIAGMNSLQAELGNLPPALAKLKGAALDGDGAAIFDLATREADGRGMPRDLAVAAKLYEKLATAGYAPAQYKLGGQYEKGSGLVRDLDKAKLWYGRAAEQGHARSMHNLAVLYAENPAANGKPDFASAASWFRQGAEFGVRDSQYNLGVLYARGLGLTQDLAQSYAWFAAAAAQGDEDAAKKRDDVANKLSPADLAKAKSLAASFKPRKIDAAVNEPPAPKAAAGAPMSLLGAPTPNTVAFSAPARRT
jgi:localization factor PodJL